MSEENAPQKERFLREVEQQLLRKELDAKLLEDCLVSSLRKGRQNNICKLGARGSAI